MHQVVPSGKWSPLSQTNSFKNINLLQWTESWSGNIPEVLENQVILYVLEHQKGPLAPGQEPKYKSITEVIQIDIDTRKA